MMNENWLEIVDSYNSTPFRNLSRTEAILKASSWFRMLGWKKSNGSLSLNTYADESCLTPIILSLISSAGNPQPIIAVAIIQQPRSNGMEIATEAMALTDCPICLIISDNVSLYCKSDKEENPVLGGSINFNSKDDNGAKLSSFLSFDRFEIEPIISLCHELIDIENRLSNLRKDIYAIPLDQDLFRSFLKDALLPMGYSESEIASEIRKVKFQIVPVDATTPSDFIREEKPKGTHDNTKFSFDGVNFYNKRDFVLKLIQKYVQDHPMVTFDELEHQFPSRIISKKRGVIRPLEVVMQWVEENPGVRDRFCLNPDEIITLCDGMQIAVHNQWGKHFPKILNIAKQLYTITSNKPYCFEIIDADTVEDTSESTASDNGITISETSLKSFIHK